MRIVVLVMRLLRLRQYALEISSDIRISGQLRLRCFVCRIKLIRSYKLDLQLETEVSSGIRIKADFYITSSYLILTPWSLLSSENGIVEIPD